MFVFQEEEVSSLDATLANLYEQLAVKQSRHEKAKAELQECEKRFQKLDGEMNVISEQTDTIRVRFIVVKICSVLSCSSITWSRITQMQI